MATPIRVHPRNSKIFEFRDRPLMLLAASEHYGAVMNRPFDMDEYLRDVSDKGLTLTRLFTLFRELQTSINPYSTCKPETPDYIAPYVRSGPGRALDQELKYDLDRPNPEFYGRLHRFVSRASDIGLVVEVVLLSNTYAPHIWELNPLNAANNVNDVEAIGWCDYLSQRHPRLFDRQVAHVQRIVRELNSYDNVIFEVCNEPGGSAPGTDGPNPDEVNAWLAALIRVIRETEADLPNTHLVAGQQCFRYEPWEQNADLSFQDLDYDVVNMHPLPNTTYDGNSYDLGVFMSKQLALRPMRDFARATYATSKPLNQDEDNVASQYKDVDGWTIHRKRAWATLLSGAHYDYIDFSIVPGRESGSPEAQGLIRSWMQYLCRFIHSLDLVRSRPIIDLIREQPSNTLEVVFGVPGDDYVIYVADERELRSARGLPDGDDIDRGAGTPIEGVLALDLPEGLFEVSCFDPKTGSSVSLPSVRGGKDARLQLPTLVHDLVFRLQRIRS